MCWNFPSAGIALPFGPFPVMISPETNTRLVQCTRAETESEVALSDWFVFTSGSTLADDELVAYTCTAVCVKHFPYEKWSARFKFCEAGVCSCVCVLECLQRLCIIRHVREHVCLPVYILCERQKMHWWERREECTVCWWSCYQFTCSDEGLAWSYLVPVYSTLSMIYNLIFWSISNNWIKVCFWPNST